jgi:hypothetical protein
MADLKTLEAAFMNAHRAGDTKAASTLAAEIKRVRAAGTTVPVAAHVPTAPAIPQWAADMGMTPEDYGTIAKRSSQGMGIPQRLDDAARLIASGLTFGAADKFAGAMNQATGISSDGEAAERERTEGARGRLGAPGAALEIGASVAPVARLAQLGITATRLPGALGRFAGPVIDAAGIGGLSAAGHSEDIGAGAQLGATIGAGTQIGGRLASGLVGALRRSYPGLNLEQLEKAGSAAFEEAKNSGVIFSQQAMARLRDKVVKKFTERSFHPGNEPGAAIALGEIERLAQQPSVTFSGLHAARTLANNSYRPGARQNNALIRKVRDKIDDLIANPQPGDVLVGPGVDPQRASESFKKARDLWSRLRKGEKVEKLLRAAQLNTASSGAGGNIENASKQQLKRLELNDRLARGMTKDELKAAARAVEGSGPQNLLRLLGKLSPQGNGLMLAINAAHSAASPMTGIPLAAAGYGAKKISEAMTRSKADYLRALIASGGNATAMKVPDTDLQKLMKSKLLPALLASGGLTMGAQ